MAKLNVKGVKTAVSSPVTTTAQTPTALGGTGYSRDAKSELYLLAVTNMVGESTFHEGAGNRDDRYARLVRQVAVEDVLWLKDMLGWLRTEGIRTAAVVGAAEAVHERTQKGLHEENTLLILSVLQRADEPGEFLAYWHSRFGRALPKSVRRGLGLATQNLYTEKSYLKWDSPSRPYRMADLLRITHAKPENDYRRDLHQYILARRLGHDGVITDALPVLRNNTEWRTAAAGAREKPTRKFLEASGLLDPSVLKAAGLTWEDVLSALGSKVDKKILWEALIPSMGLMALVRNLRNFDQSGVSDDVAQQVADRLMDPEQIKRSKMFPMRFLSAYNAAPSLRWSWALDRALDASLGNIPVLKGRTLIMVDTSSSMAETFSKDGSLKRWDAAALFGIALGRRCESADVVSFSSKMQYWGDAKGANTKHFPLKKGLSLLSAVQEWKTGGWFLGGGTDTALALRQEYGGHDRVAVVTDEQVGFDPVEVSRSVPGTVPMYTWNLAGYAAGHAESSVYRHTYGGLTDSAFRQIGLMENSANGRWPWQTA